MKITITAEMREALRLYEAAENELRIRHADGNEHGASVWMDAVQRRARLLAGLVDEAVEQADREEARRREAEQRQRADEWALHESYTIDEEPEPPTQIPEAPEAWADVTDEDLDAALRDLRSREEPPPCGAMRTPADITACNRPRGHDGPHRGEAYGAVAPPHRLSQVGEARPALRGRLTLGPRILPRLTLGPLRSGRPRGGQEDGEHRGQVEWDRRGARDD